MSLVGCRRIGYWVGWVDNDPLSSFQMNIDTANLNGPFEMGLKGPVNWVAGRVRGPIDV